MRSLPESKDKKFWLEQGERIANSKGCEHKFALHPKKRECICKFCGVGFYAQPQEVDETNKKVRSKRFGTIPFTLSN